MSGILLDVTYEGYEKLDTCLCEYLYSQINKNNFMESVLYLNNIKTQIYNRFLVELCSMGTVT